MDNSDYGFFCDVETAIINDYEKAEYYVATTRTRYEVRRKIVQTVELTTESINKDDTKIVIDEDCFQTEEKQDVGCFSGIWKRICRIPKDVYYSFAICSITASCVVLVMTYDTEQ